MTDLIANPDNAKIKMAIRDFDRHSFSAENTFIKQAIELIKARHPRAKLSAVHFDVYSKILATH